MAFSNDGSFMAQYLANLKNQEVSTAETSSGVAANQQQEQHGEQFSQQNQPEALPLPNSSAAIDTDFMPSSSFGGTRTGFVFKMEAFGLGYYKDVPLHVRKQQADAAKAKPPAVIKSRSIAGVPAAKGGVTKKKPGQ